MWKEAVELFRQYMGTGLIAAWFVISLAYLWASEKRRSVRVLLLYVPVIVLLLYFNPLFIWPVYGVLGGTIYYRVLWLLPITPTIAYTCVSIYGKLADGRGKRAAGLFALGAAVSIALSGRFIYADPHFSKAENIYHMPESVVHICDEIIVPGREVMAVFPIELVQYVRQYTSLICMPYGREMLSDAWFFENRLYDLMKAEVIDLAALNREAVEKRCHYAILRENQKVEGDFADYGWELRCRTDGYCVYRITGYPLELP